MKSKIIILTATALAVACGAWLSMQPARHITNTIFHPGYGACGRCNKTWDVVSGHNTPYEWSKPGEMHMLVSGENVAATNIFGGNIPKKLAEYLSKPHPIRLCFPLCETCWRELKTPQARLPYYRELLNVWKKEDVKGYGEELWLEMKASVLAGN